MKSKLLVGLMAAVLLLARPVLGTSQLIVNGDFTADNPSFGWEFGEASNDTNGILFEQGFLSMGNVPGSVQQVADQVVTIPSNTLSLQLSFVISGTSTDGKNSGRLLALISSAGFDISFTNLMNMPNGNFGPTITNFNLVGLAGKTIQVAFMAQVDAGADNTSFHVTDVSLLDYNASDIPANDNFANAAQLTRNGLTVAFGNNVLATTELGDPVIAPHPSGHSVWWFYDSPSNGLAAIDTGGSSFNTALGVFTGNSISNLTPVASNVSGSNISRVQFPITNDTIYYVMVDGINGQSGNVQLNLTSGGDVQPPTVVVKSPLENAKVTNSTLVVQGTASDNTAVSRVQVQLVNSAGTNQVFIATGTNTWSATVTGLLPGTNTIAVVAFDPHGNATPAITRVVNYTPVSPLVLTISGTGTVSPVLTNTLLTVGSNYTLTAKAGLGQVFSNWTGNVSATTPTLTFTMQNNMSLQATFVPTPFPSLTGVYQGIFNAIPTEHTNSGFFSGTVASSGAFTSKVILAGKSYSMSGQFSAGGEATATIVRKGLPTVTAQLTMDMSGRGITGTISDGSFNSQLNAQRAMTNAAALAGSYTVLIPGVDFIQTEPGGFSYGTVTVISTGGLTFTGELADGTKVSQKTSVLADGTWPFYIALYSGLGSIFGTMTFSNLAASDITGPVNWFKLPQAKAKFYPQGFVNSVTAIGSLFTNASPVLNFNLSTVAVYGDPLADGITNQIFLGASNRVTNNSPNALTLTITTKNGTFKGSVVDPNSSKPVAFTGALLQKQNFGGGFFLGTSESGNVIFGTEPEP